MTFSAIHSDAIHTQAIHSNTVQAHTTHTHTAHTHAIHTYSAHANSTQNHTSHAHIAEQSHATEQSSIAEQTHIVQQARIDRQSSNRTSSYRASSNLVTSKTLLVDGLEVHVIRKPIKRLYLRVKPPAGEIVVTAPNRVPQRDIVALVRERKDWIARARQHVSSSASQQAQQPWSQERIDQAHAILNQRIPPLLRHWVPIIGKSPIALTLRRMKTRWGSCTPATGRIRINLELAYLPEQYLEYVLVHELTHLWERGHGAGFQRRMTQYLPQWKQLRSQLNNIVLR